MNEDLFAAFGGYELWLNLHLRALHDDVMEACYKPAVIPKRREEFYFPPGKPVLGVMVDGR